MVCNTRTDHIPRNTTDTVPCFMEDSKRPNTAMQCTHETLRWREKPKGTVFLDNSSTVSLPTDDHTCCYSRNFSIQPERKPQHIQPDSRRNLTTKNCNKSLRLSTRSPPRVMVRYLVLLVFLASVGVRADMSAFSPGSALNTLARGRGSEPVAVRPRKLRAGESVQRAHVSESEVKQHLYKNGARDQALTSASTGFMMKVFNNLLAGRSITEAVGARRNKRTIERSDTVRSFPAIDKPIQTRRGKQVQVKFKLPLLPPLERLRAAEVRVRNHGKLGGTLLRQRAKLRLNIWTGEDKRQRSKAATRVRPTQEDQYTVFNLGNILDSWINDRHGNLTVTVRLPQLYVLPGAAQAGSKDLQASASDRFMIVLFLEDGKFLSSMYVSYTQEQESTQLMQSDQAVGRSRQKRHKGGRRAWRRRTAGPCQLVDFLVDFDLIGWGQWVIEPRAYNSRFCYGECSGPLDLRFNLTNHAIMQKLMRMRKRSLAPNPCCVPTKLRPISMLYFEYGQIMVRHHNDMIATECGCR